jgi:hypothetical protein
LRIVVPDQDELNWRGEWSSAITYQNGDVVYREGSSYRATETSLNVDPVSGTPIWELVALRGERGPQGPSSGSGYRVEHRQDIAAAVWTIEHNFGILPTSVVVVDSAGTRVFGDEDLSATPVTITFGAQFSGTAIVAA